MALKEQLPAAQWEDLTHFEGNANAFRLLTHQFEGRVKVASYLPTPLWQVS